MNRLFHSLAKSLPGLSLQTLFWRVHFALGSLSHIMRCHERHGMVPEGVEIDMDVEKLVELFLDFSATGMEAKER